MKVTKWEPCNCCLHDRICYNKKIIIMNTPEVYNSQSANWVKNLESRHSDTWFVLLWSSLDVLLHIMRLVVFSSLVVTAVVTLFTWINWLQQWQDRNTKASIIAMPMCLDRLLLITLKHKHDKCTVERGCRRHNLRSTKYIFLKSWFMIGSDFFVIFMRHENPLYQK